MQVCVLYKGTVNAILTSTDNTITLPAGYYDEATISTSITSLPGTISYTYHKHIDSNNDEHSDSDVIYSKTNPGGCFGASGHIHNKTGNCTRGACGGSTYTTTTWRDNTWVQCSQCSRCGLQGAAGSSGGGTCNNQVYTCGNYTNVWKIKCGKTTSTIESATIIY